MMTTRTRMTRSQKTAATLGIPAGSFAYFEALARDAGNWSGTPWTEGNVSAGKSTPGYTRKLVAAGLISTQRDSDGTSVAFTIGGVRAAARLGIDLTAWYPEYHVDFKAEANRAKATRKDGTTMTASTTPAKKAPAKKVAAKKAAASAARSGQPAPGHSGYEILWTRRGGVFAKNVSGDGGPAWLVICDHGNFHDAERTGTGENGTRTVLADRASWCAKCAAEEKADAVKPAKKAPAKSAAPAKKAPAKKATGKSAPAKTAAPAKRTRSRAKALEADAAKLASKGGRRLTAV